MSLSKFTDTVAALIRLLTRGAGAASPPSAAGSIISQLSCYITQSNLDLPPVARLVTADTVRTQTGQPATTNCGLSVTFRPKSPGGWRSRSRIGGTDGRPGRAWRRILSVDSSCQFPIDGVDDLVLVAVWVAM